MGKKKAKKKFVPVEGARPGERQRSYSEGHSEKKVQFNLADNEVYLFTPPRRRKRQEIFSARQLFDGTDFDIHEYVAEHRLTLKSSRNQRHRPLSAEEESELDLQGILSDTSASASDVDDDDDHHHSVPVPASGRERYFKPGSEGEGASSSADDGNADKGTTPGAHATIPGLGDEDEPAGLSKSARKRRRKKAQKAANRERRRKGQQEADAGIATSDTDMQADLQLKSQVDAPKDAVVKAQGPVESNDDSSPSMLQSEAPGHSKDASSSRNTTSLLQDTPPPIGRHGDAEQQTRAQARTSGAGPLPIDDADIVGGEETPDEAGDGNRISNGTDAPASKKKKKKKKKKKTGTAPQAEPAAASAAFADTVITPIAVQGLRLPEQPSLDFPAEPKYDLFSHGNRAEVSVFVPMMPPELLDVLLRNYGICFRVGAWHWGLKFPHHVLPSGCSVRVTAKKLTVKLLKAREADEWVQSQLKPLSDKGQASFLSALDELKPSSEPDAESNLSNAHVDKGHVEAPCEGCGHAAVHEGPLAQEGGALSAAAGVNDASTTSTTEADDGHTIDTDSVNVDSATGHPRVSADKDIFAVPNDMLKRAGLEELIDTAQMPVSQTAEQTTDVLEQLEAELLADDEFPNSSNLAEVSAVVTELKSVQDDVGKDDKHEQDNVQRGDAHAADDQTNDHCSSGCCSHLGAANPRVAAAHASPRMNSDIVDDARGGTEHDAIATGRLSSIDEPIQVIAGPGKSPGVDVPFLNHDWQDEGDFVRITVLANTTSRKVLFNEQSLLLRFKSEDRRLWPTDDCNANTVLSWALLLAGPIAPNLCTFNNRPSGLSIILVKAVKQPWPSLEWVPGSGHARQNGHFVLSTSEEPINLPESPATSHTSHVESADDIVNDAVAQHEYNAEEHADESKQQQDQIHAQLSEIQAEPSDSDDTHMGDYKLINTSAPAAASTPDTAETTTVKETSGSQDATANMVQLPTLGGRHGLRNLGNTCFMNSVIQCLAQLPSLASFFLDEQRVLDVLNTHPKSLGSGGHIAASFFDLMTELWNDQDRYTVNPRKFKSNLGRRSERFRGFGQQDAQEFLEFLLDELHEDTNRIVQKPYVEIKDSDGRPDEVIAEETRQALLTRDDSPILDMFQGQLRSKLTCPQCQNVSITFNPFRSLSLPLPSVKKEMEITFLPARNGERIVYSVPVPARPTLADIAEAVSVVTGKNEENLVPVSVGPHDITFDSMPSRYSKRQVWVFEISNLDSKSIVVVHQKHLPWASMRKCRVCGKTASEGSEDEPAIKLKRCTRCRQEVYCSTECQTQHWASHRTACARLRTKMSNVGIPFIIEVDRSVSYNGLKAQLKQRACQLAQTQQMPMQRGLVRFKQMGLSDEGVNWSSDTPEELEKLAKTNMFVDLKLRLMRALRQNNEQMTRFSKHFVEVRCQDAEDVPVVLNKKEKDERQMLPTVIQAELVWGSVNKKALADLRDATTMDATDDESVLVKQEKSGDPSRIKLEQVLSNFSDPETLGKDDTWYCPKCKEHVQATKELSPWRLPDNLVIHLKRFSFRNIIFRDKLEHFIEYPHVLHETDILPSSHPDREAAAAAQPYYLTGVIHHFGSLAGGHYIAVAKHAVTGEWFKYDDSRVSPTTADSAIAKSGYVLVYSKPSSTIPRGMTPTSETIVANNGGSSHGEHLAQEDVNDDLTLSASTDRSDWGDLNDLD